MYKNLLIISNRLPIMIKIKKGKNIIKNSIGGLATGLAACYKLYNCKWVGWPGISFKKIKKDKSNLEAKFISEFNCYPVFLSQKNIDNFYYGFCNSTIWPHFHYFTQYTVYKKEFWDEYKQVNMLFCEKVLELAEPEDIIWIHDFHLMLLPKLIRQKRPNAIIGFFLHILFPSFEIFRLLPWRKEILKGILGADLIGFHTYDYVRYFLSSTYRLLGLDAQLGQIFYQNRRLKVDTFPIGIDYEKFFKIQNNISVQDRIKEIQNRIEQKRIILSIDRLDYTKGIPQRLKGFDRFLEKYPEFRKKVTFICVAVPSRSIVENYRILKQQTDELIGQINGKYGGIGWTPIWYLYRQIPFQELAALYSVADVALITPYRDGMNLIAKEFVATKTNGLGVLILSESAGAMKELGEALIINPNDIEEIADSLNEALTMPEKAQIRRNRQMQRRLQRYNIIRWAGEFLSTLKSIKENQKDFLTKELSQTTRNLLIKDYLNSKSRLLLLDYDGTLIEYFDNPLDAKPTIEILQLLKSLAEDKRNTLVLVSGRKKDELTKWFKDLNIDMVAEHSVWIKEKNQDWKLVEPVTNEWKEEIRPILELYSDRTPGSFIEEKEFSIAWHYRKVDSELGTWRARELADVLVNFTANYNLQILEGNKIIEIKNSRMNKGKAALQWISNNDWDFIFALGDDWTDEDIFKVLPKNAYSIKIGPKPSQAKYRFKTPNDMRLFLKELIKRG